MEERTHAFMAACMHASRAAAWVPGGAAVEAGAALAATPLPLTPAFPAPFILPNFYVAAATLVRAWRRAHGQYRAHTAA